jgi:predicted MarR family transcription regulator
LRHALCSRQLADSVAAVGEESAAEYARLKEALGRVLRPGPEMIEELERVARNV